jgi:hypothetical protein
MIHKIFSPKNVAKKVAFFAQSTASFFQKLDHNIEVFFRKTLFFSLKIDKNRRKL